MKNILISFLLILVLSALTGLAVYVYYENWYPVDDNITDQQVIGDIQESREDIEDQSDISEDLEPEDFDMITKELVLEDGTEKNINIAEGFNISVAAHGLGKARFMTISPDGRMFVPDQVDYRLSHEGKIYVLDDFNEDTYEFEKKDVYLSGLRGVHNVSFYTDEDGRDWIYITLTEHLIRYPYEEGDTEPSSEPEVVYSFPNVISPTTDGTVWHITRTVIFRDDVMYVSVGSGCNACEQPEDEMRAMILTMDPSGENVEIYSEGIKNAVGMMWVSGDLYATENGVDHLGNDAPDDLMFRVVKGEHYGWPYCYEVNGVKYEDDYQNWGEAVSCDDVPMSFSAFEPHSAPLGFDYFGNDAHPALRNSFLLALQGSFNPEVGSGHQIVRISKEGDQDTFIDGFYENKENIFGKPVHVLQKNEGSFFFTDDLGGRVYYVYSS